MKILHIVPSHWPAFERGGPIRSVHLLNKWLVKKGIDVTVYTTDIGLKGKVEINKEVLLDGVKVWYFPLTWRAWQYSRAMHKALKKNLKDFDLVHITSTFLAASTLGAYYAKKFKKPYIISPRGNLMKEPLKKKSPIKKRIYISLIEKRNLTGANAIHFTAEVEKNEYLAENLPLKKSIVIPNGLDPKEFGREAVGENRVNFREKFDIGADKKIILSLGRINWKKGFDTLIPALAEVLKEEPDVVFVIAGDDDGYKKQVESLISSSKLENNVVFTGQLLGEERIAAYRDSDVFVLSSYSENFGMVVVEAMYFEKPVILTEGVGISKEVKNSGAGIVIQKDEKKLAEAILKILGNQELAKKMGEAGKKLVQEEFSGEKVAERWVEAYRNIV